MATTLTGADIQLQGKTYEGRVRYVCKKMVDGGCAITTYCVLSFKAETVDVHYYAKASCTPKEREAKYSYDDSDDKKTYKWSKSGNMVTIKDFKDYGAFTYQDGKLIAGKGEDEEDELEFIEK